MALHSASAHEVSSAKVKKPTTISCLKSAHRWNYESQNENVTNIWQNHNANCKCHCKLACYENDVLRVIFYFYMLEVFLFYPLNLVPQEEYVSGNWRAILQINLHSKQEYLFTQNNCPMGKTFFFRLLWCEWPYLILGILSKRHVISSF